MCQRASYRSANHRRKVRHEPLQAQKSPQPGLSGRPLGRGLHHPQGARARGERPEARQAGRLRLRPRHDGRSHRPARRGGDLPDGDRLQHAHLGLGRRRHPHRVDDRTPDQPSQEVRPGPHGPRRRLRLPALGQGRSHRPREHHGRGRHCPGLPQRRHGDHRHRARGAHRSGHLRLQVRPEPGRGVPR